MLDRLRILQSIAAGWLGRDSYSGGAATALLGTLSHFAIAIVASATFYAASLRLSGLVHHVFVAGAVFGLGMYGVMNFIVVPLSAVARSPASAPLTTITGLLVHMFLVGVPIALGARQASRRALAPRSD